MKKTKQIIVSSVAALSLSAAGLPLNVFSVPFSDINGHWAQSAIEKWNEHEIFEGFEGLFKPDDEITRAEMAVIIDRLMVYQPAPDNPFQDLTEEWYKEAMINAAANGVLQGFEGQARPDDTITREEAAVMLARALHIEPQTAEIPFSDRESISDWARDLVAAMAEKQYIKGFEDGSFAPQENMTRAYTIALLDNTIGGFYNKPGTYTDQVRGIVLVSAPNVILKNMEIDDIVLAPGVGGNKVTLQGSSKILGNKVILSGSIVSSGSSNIGGGTVVPPGGSGGSGGGGSSVSTAPQNSIIVNSSYEGQSGTIEFERKKYTFGTNAFGTLREALLRAEALGQQVTISLTGDMTVENTLEVSAKELTLKGNGHTIAFTQSAGAKKDGMQIINADQVSLKNVTIKMEEAANGWHGSYGIQAYQTRLNLDQVKISGADAGLLCNGSIVDITGTTDISGNEFGGIEMAKGADVEQEPVLNDNFGHLVNSSEAEGLPTVWVDHSDQLDAVVNVSGMFAKELSKNGKIQKHFYLNEANLPQDETVQEVEDADGLQTAINDEAVDFIRLTEDISATESLTITRDVIINGQGHSITAPMSAKQVITVLPAAARQGEGRIEISNMNVAFTGPAPETWQGLYGIQIYRADDVVLRNLTASNGNAGILVNGSGVTLGGTIDVSGNTFGGIEVSKGEGVDTMPHLTGTVSGIRNTSEAVMKPTIWTDGDDIGPDCVTVTGITAVEQAKPTQNHFYLNPELAAAEAHDEVSLRAALANEKASVVNLAADISAQTTIEITRPVTLNGQGHTILTPLTAKNILVLKPGGAPITRGRISNLALAFEGGGAPESWQSAYALQIYRSSNIVLENVSAQYGNAGILVNGSSVSLEGTIDVSNNSFGGIEVSKGENVEQEPSLLSNGAVLTNTTEVNGKPTVWTDRTDAAAVRVPDLTSVPFTENDKDQTHFYLDAVNALPVLP